MLPFPFGILNVVCKVSLISLIDFSDGCCITDINCACLTVIFLIITYEGLASIDTDPNVVIVDTTPFIFVLMLYLKLSCCRHPSSDKTIRYSSSFFTSSLMILLPRKVCRSDAYSLTAIMSLCNPSTVFELLDSCFNRLSICVLILSVVSSSSYRIFCSIVSKCEFILAHICLSLSFLTSFRHIFLPVFRNFVYIVCDIF